MCTRDSYFILQQICRCGNILLLKSKFICRPDISELETKLSEQSKLLLNLLQKVDDLAAKVYSDSLASC